MDVPLGDIHEVRRYFLRGRGLPNTDIWWHEGNQKSWIKGWRTLWTASGSTKFLLFWGRRRTEACTVIAVVHIGGRFTFWSRILNLRIKSLWLLFGIFCQKVLETNLNFRCQRVRNQKKIYQLLKLPLFFQFLTENWDLSQILLGKNDLKNLISFRYVSFM